MDQDNVKSMVATLEGQIAELNEDLKKVDNWVTKSFIKQAIKESEVLLENAKAKLI